MHFEILVEDQSGKKALHILTRKIVGDQHTFNIYPYRGIGHIPKDLTNPTNANTNLLLNQLPMQLRAYGKSYANDPTKVVVVVCDLDNNCLKTFRQELFAVLSACPSKPETRFCIAIEEGEAWLLGDVPAIKKAYQNDSICGTRELLADALFTRGASRLKKRGWQAAGREKFVWAQKITPYMNVDKNASPSFCYFRDKIRELI